jgi:hypothetical protein
MSDYVNMGTIMARNQIMRPEILDKVRNGELTLRDVQDTHSPLSEIYKNTYNYLFTSPVDVYFKNSKLIIIPNTDPSNSSNFYMEKKIIIQ